MGRFVVRFVGRVVVRFGGRIVVLDVASCCVGGLNHVEDPSRIRIWWLLPGYVGRFVGRFVVRFVGRVVVRFVGRCVVRFVSRCVVWIVNRVMVLDVASCGVGGLNNVEDLSGIRIRWLLPGYVGRFVIRFLIGFVGKVVVLDEWPLAVLAALYMSRILEDPYPVALAS